MGVDRIFGRLTSIAKRRATKTGIAKCGVGAPGEEKGRKMPESPFADVLLTGISRANN